MWKTDNLIMGDSNEDCFCILNFASPRKLIESDSESRRMSERNKEDRHLSPRCCFVSLRQGKCKGSKWSFPFNGISAVLRSELAPLCLPQIATS